MNTKTLKCKENDPFQAITFLRGLDDKWGMHLYSFKNRVAVVFHVHGAESLADSDFCDELIDWLNERHAARENVYYALNPLLDSARDKKAFKWQVARVCWVHVDIDPEPFRPGPDVGPGLGTTPESHLKSERDRIARMLTDGEWLRRRGLPGEPTILVNSGRGFQALWELAQPVEITSDIREQRIAAAEEIEQHTRGVARLLGADHCHDISRILRLPGTVNFPDPKKLAAGMPESGLLAEMYLEPNGLTYKLEDFKKISDIESAQDDLAAASTGKAQAPKADRPAVSVKRCMADPESLSDPMELEERWGVAPRTIERIVYGGNDLDPKTHDSRSENVFGVVRELLRRGVPDSVILWIITNAEFKIAAHVLDPSKNKGHRGPIGYGRRQITRAKEENARDAATSGAEDDTETTTAPPSEDSGETGDDGRRRRRVLDKNDLDHVASQFKDQVYPNLVLINGDWLSHSGSAYQEVEPIIIEREIRSWLRASYCRVVVDKKPATVRFVPESKHVSEVYTALRQTYSLPSNAYEPPVWLKREKGDPPAKEILACRNTLLHLPTLKRLPLTPRLFTRNALDFDLDENPPEPKRWLQFLDEVWKDDTESISTLQEMFGYLLLPDTSQQKIFLLLGPRRSGKGTIGRILRQLIGEMNTCAPTVSSLGQDKGRACLIGKQLAMISDMRLGPKTDTAVLTEILLGISGEDPQTIPRKFKEDWNGRLSTRFLIMTNDEPNFPDSSRALASRFLPLVMNQSFYGREDPGLYRKLVAELSGILMWAVEGWRRLNERGHFLVGQASRECIDDLADLGSPISTFVMDCCELDSEGEVQKDDLYKAYRQWCAENGSDHPLAKAGFFSRLNSAFRGQVRQVQHRFSTGDGRRGSLRVLAGLKLLPRVTRPSLVRDDPF